MFFFIFFNKNVIFTNEIIKNAAEFVFSLEFFRSKFDFLVIFGFRMENKKALHFVNVNITFWIEEGILVNLVNAALPVKGIRTRSFK